MAARNTFEGDVEYTGQDAIDLFNAIKDFYGYDSNSNGEVPAPKVYVIDATGATGGGSDLAFQFPKGEEAYYKENYPAFYNFVMNDLPKIINEPNFMKVLSELSGFTIEELNKIFSSETAYGLISHNEIGYSNGDYPHASYPTVYPINMVRVNIKVLNWFEKANRDTTSREGIINLFYMTVLIGHEINHWGEAEGLRIPFVNTTLSSQGYNDVGDLFENILLKDTYYKRGVGDAGNISAGINAYVNKNFNLLYNIFNKK